MKIKMRPAFLKDKKPRVNHHENDFLADTFIAIGSFADDYAIADLAAMATAAVGCVGAHILVDLSAQRHECDVGFFYWYFAGLFNRFGIGAACDCANSD